MSSPGREGRTKSLSSMATRPWVAAWLSLALRDQPAAERAAEARSLARAPGDWDALGLELRLQGLLGRGLELLRPLGPSLVPEALVQDLRGHQQRQEVWALMIQDTLARVAPLLAKARIPLIVIKGPILSVQLHDDPATREYVDLDLWIPAARRERAVAILAGLGYRVHYRGTPRGRVSALRAGSSLTLVGPHGLLIDLHWGLGGRSFRFDIGHAAAWGRRQDVRLAGRVYAGLGPEDQVVYLCAHGGKHLWAKWSCLADVARHLNRHPALDCDQVLGIARKAGALRALRVGLFLAARLARARIPAPLAADMQRDPIARALAGRIEQGLRAGPIAEVNSWVRLALRLRLRERPQDRALDLFGFLLEAFRPRFDGAEAPRHPVLGYGPRFLHMLWKHRRSLSTRSGATGSKSTVR